MDVASVQDRNEHYHPTPHAVQVQSCNTHPSLHVVAQCLHYVSSVHEAFGAAAGMNLEAVDPAIDAFPDEAAV